MQGSKIIRLLKSLDAAEFRLFHKYLRSPFFNYSPAIIALYEVLRKYYPTFEHDLLAREKVFARVFPGEAFQEKKLRNLMHEFLGHVEQFLVELRIKNDHYLRRKLLMGSFANRELYGEFLQKKNELTLDLENRSGRGIRTYQELLDLQEQYYFHTGTDKLQEGGDALRSLLRYLDRYFMANKLRLANEVAGLQKVVRQRIEIPFLAEVLREVEQGRHNDTIFQVYALLYQLNENEEKSTFLKIKEYLLSAQSNLEYDDQQTVVHQLINFTIRQANSGAGEFYAIGFELYQWALQKGLLFYRGKMTDSTFTNVVVHSVRSGAVEWAEAFISDYQSYLEEDLREDATMLSLAFVHYSKGAFEKVDQLIGMHQFNSVFYQLRSRSILLRALFELFVQNASYYDLLVSRKEAFEKYLRRNKVLSDQQKRPYLAFIKYLRQLSKLMVQNDPPDKKIRKLKSRIEQAESLLHKDWLRDQMKMVEPH